MPAGFEPTRLHAVLKRFGIRRCRLTPYASFYKANAAFRVSANRRAWLLKPFNKRKTRRSAVQQIKAVASCIRKLEKEHYAHMPCWRTTASGRYWVMQNGRPYYMSEWVKGRKLLTQPQDFEALGQALAKLHNIRTTRHGRKRSCTFQQQKMLRAEEIRFRRHLHMIRKNKISTARWFASHGSECKALTDQAWKLLNRAETRQILEEEAKRAALIHGDVTLPNVIVASGRAKLIDWDNVRIGSAYFEIAKTLANVTGFNLKLLHALLKGYEEIKPLRVGERLLVAGLFRFPREAWYSAKALAHGRRHSVYGIVKRTWADRLAAIEWLDRWTAGQSEEMPNG